MDKNYKLQLTIKKLKIMFKKFSVWRNYLKKCRYLPIISNLNIFNFRDCFIFVSEQWIIILVNKVIVDNLTLRNQKSQETDTISLKQGDTVLNPLTTSYFSLFNMNRSDKFDFFIFILYIAYKLQKNV